MHHGSGAAMILMVAEYIQMKRGNRLLGLYEKSSGIGDV